jgi:WD40 repeat protein
LNQKMKRGGSGNRDDDLLRSFLPQSFGAKKQKLDVSEKLNETKRTKRVTLVRKRKITDEDADGTEEQTSESGISVSEASKAIITDEGQSLLGKKGYVVIGPPKPKTRVVEEIEEVEVEEEDTETSEYDKLLPVSHEIKLKGHTKVLSPSCDACSRMVWPNPHRCGVRPQAITALALDTGGARLLTGSNDYMVRFWDFAGMDSAHRSFRDVEPHSGHQVRSLSYSINGDQFLVTTGNAKAKIYSRDGHEMYRAGLPPSRRRRRGAHS